MATAMEMEVDSDDTEYFNLWEVLKKRLDEDMPPDHLQEAVYLLKGKIQITTEVNLPSEVLTHLETVYPEGQALSIMKHVLGATSYHRYGDSEFSYVSLIEEYENKMKKFAKNENFVGRTEELKEITQMFTSSSPVIGYWIYGIGGMGKTTLMYEVCARVCSKSEYQWIIINLKESDGFDDMLMEFLHGMGRYSSETLVNTLQEDVLAGVRWLERDTVVVFDSIECILKDHKKQFNTLMKDLVAISKNSKQKIKLIFTSRSPLKHLKGGNLQRISEVNLQPMSKSEAMKLLRLLVKPVQPHELENAVDLNDFERIPFNIKMFAKMIVDAGMDQIQQRRLSVKHMMEECVKSAFDYLVPTRQIQMTMLLIFESTPFDIDDASAGLDETVNDALLVLLDLRNSQLVQEYRGLDCNDVTSSLSGQFRYRIHPIVLTVLKNINKETEKDIQRAKANLIQKILHRFERECSNFDKYYEKAIAFITKSRTRMTTLFACLSEHSHNIDVSDSQRNLLTQSVPVLLQPNERGDFLHKVANSYKRKGNKELYWFWSLEEAKIYLELKVFDQADRNTRNIKESGLKELKRSRGMNAILLAEYYLTKARVRRGQKLYTKATKAAKTSLNILLEWAENDIPRLAAVHNAIGNILFDKDCYDESYGHHKEAVDIMTGYVKEESLDLSIYLYNLGTVAYAKSQQLKSNNENEAKRLCREALKFYDKSMEFDMKLKLDKLYSHTEKLKIRARAHRYLGEYDKAIADAEKSVKTKKKLLLGGPKTPLILGYYQVAELYLKKRQSLRKQRGVENLREKEIRYLKTSWKWFQEAAFLIKTEKDNGLPPDHEESPQFAHHYEEVANAISERLGKPAGIFCENFLAGAFFKSDSEEEKTSTGTEPSSEDEMSDETEHERKGSGVHDSASSLVPSLTDSLASNQFSLSDTRRQSSNDEQDSDFIDAGESGIGSLPRKRARSDSD